MSLNRYVLTAACVAAGFALASCAQNTQTPHADAEPAQQIRGAVSGVKQQIAQFIFVNPDCMTGGSPTLKLVKAPQHGQISIEQGVAYPEFPKDNVRSVCNNKKVPATLIFYTSEPGYTGTDTVTFDRIGVLGAYGFHDYKINVR